MRNFFRRLFVGLLLFPFAFAAAPAAAAPGDVLGKVLTKLPNGWSVGYRTFVLGDGKVLIAGMAGFGTGQLAVTRLNADGSVDTSYGTRGGTTYQAFRGFPSLDPQLGAALQSDGKLVVATMAQNQADDRFGVARFNTDGTLDTTFAGGTPTFKPGVDRAAATAVTIQADGRILVGGWSQITSASTTHEVFTVIRLNPDGTLDTSYGSNGAYIDPSDTFEDLYSMALQPDGKLVIAGEGPGTEFRIQRLDPDGSLDTSWGTSGKTAVSGFRYGRDMKIAADGSVLVSGSYAPARTAEYFAAARFTSAGLLDTTFGSSGIAMAPHATGNSAGLVLQSDGKIVISGWPDGITTGYAFYLVRFNADGSVDTTFGNGGEASALVNPAVEWVVGVALRSNGGFVVTGSYSTSTTPGMKTAAVAFTAGGALDTSFAGTGYDLLDLGSASAFATGSAFQADGKLVVAGSYGEDDDTPTGSWVVRYLADGTLDTSFGTNGIATVTARPMEHTDAVAIQPDGKIVTAGMSEVDFSGSWVYSASFARFNPDGSLDTSFGNGGVAAYVGCRWNRAVAIQPDGKIVGAGFVGSSSGSDSCITRVTASGALDTTFGSGGHLAVDLNGATNDEFYALALQADGKYVLAASGQVSGQSRMMAARVNADGTLDTSFGSGGVVTVPFPGNETWGYAVALQPDGRILVGGSAHPATNNDYALARLLPNGPLDGSFGSGGLVTTDFDGDQQGLRALKVLSSGKIVAAGGDTAGTYGIVQYLSNGALDAGFGNGGHTTIAMNGAAGLDVAHTLSIANDGTLYAAGDASHLLGLAIVAGDPVAAPSQFALTVSKAGSGSGAVTSSPPGIDCGATCSASFDAGSTVTLTATPASGSVFGGWSGGGCSGTGTCTVTMNAATSVAAAFNATAVEPTRLGNIATRGDVLTGENVLIGGFVIGGSTPKTVVVRARGPSLAAFGIANPLANPTLTLVRSSDQSVVATNDNWGDAANASQVSSSGYAPSDALESAILVTLPPGAYTGIVSGVGGGTGVGIVEVFEIDHPESPLANISTRGEVLTGENVLIGGFIVQGSSAQTVVVRARGPSLGAFGVANPLANPTLTLVRSSDQSIVATNDDWASASNAADVAASGFAPSDPRESAILVTLPPGAYTAIVSGVGGTTGVAIVEVFSAQ